MEKRKLAKYPDRHSRHEFAGYLATPGFVALSCDIWTLYAMKQREIKAGCAIMLLVVLASFCAFTTWRAFSWEDDFLFVNRDNPHWLGDTFALTLMQNRIATAKTFTDASQWPKLEAWSQEHAPVYCPPYDVMLDLPRSSVSGSCSDNEQEIGATCNYYVEINLSCGDCVYSLAIENVELQRLEEGWTIQAWDRVHESKLRK